MDTLPILLRTSWKRTLCYKSFPSTSSFLRGLCSAYTSALKSLGQVASDLPPHFSDSVKDVGSTTKNMNSLEICTETFVDGISRIRFEIIHKWKEWGGVEMR